MKIASSVHRPPLRAWVRWTALGTAAMVWLLGVLAASPQLHGAVHAQAGEAAHECAVTLFAHGADTPDVAVGVPCSPLVRELGRVGAPASHAWVAPAYRLRPACGPPCC